MHIRPYVVGTHNAYYEGAYDQREIRWRQICARDKARNIRGLLGGEAIGSVLEVGCGTGAVLLELQRTGVGSRHVGIDMADPLIHVDPGLRGHDIELIKTDGERAPFPDASFDLVYASHVIEHVPDPRSALTELARLSRGYVYVEVPCELNMRAGRDALQQTLDIGHINAYTPESFTLLLQTSGLNIVRSELFDHSTEVHAFSGSRLKAHLKRALRSGLLKANPVVASRCFTYHFGALCRSPRGAGT